MRIDVLIFGGGAAGLWCLDRIRAAGYVAVLLESTAMGCGQTIQAQGIIHGGGKYALRGVRDFAAVRATKQMPERWRRSLSGECEPDLRDARVLSDRCHLWLPRGSLVAWMQSFGFISVLSKAGLLSTPLEAVPNSAWPEALRGSAFAVYSLAEPVVETGSLLRALSNRHRKCIFLYDRALLQFARERVQIADLVLKPRSIVLAAGVGNTELLQKAGIERSLMQRRPLSMVLLRGNLPSLFGHCVVGGKTHLTITTPAPGIWQVGGEIAERLAGEENVERVRKAAMSEIRRCLPGLDFSHAKIAIYRAVRAEALTTDLRRPSGVHVSRAAPHVLVAWPTKLALAPVLADEVFALLRTDLQEPGGYQERSLRDRVTPPIARYPWEETEWFRAD
jgi:glycine/D-amino acid oxidase-like deaminating enzyme